MSSTSGSCRTRFLTSSAVPPRPFSGGVMMKVAKSSCGTVARRSGLTRETYGGLGHDTPPRRRQSVRQLTQTDFKECVVIRSRRVQTGVVVQVCAAGILYCAANHLPVEVGSARKRNIRLRSVDDSVGSRTAGHADIGGASVIDHEIA